MNTYLIANFIWIFYTSVISAQLSENCECSPPCVGTNVSLKECPTGLAHRVDCPCCEVCTQPEGKACREPDLPCDRNAGLHCAPRRKGLCQECGVNNRDPFLKRITGGQPASPKDWPWMAALIKEHARNTPFCGATLLTDKHVVTASHCLENYFPADLRVRLGEYDFNKTFDNNPMDFEISAIRKHEKYNRVTYDNDIAILTLRTTVDFNEFIWPACLPPPDMNIVNKIGLAAGWGTKSFLGHSSTILHEIAIKVWTHDECVLAHKNKIITNNMMCIGWITGEADTCQGDSGGPFMLKAPDNHQWFLTGIVSWGQECGRRNLPGLYTKVSNYLDWIEHYTQFEALDEPTPPKKDFGCENGYEHIKGLDWCVMTSSETMNWWQASQTCESKGGSLAIIDTKAKHEAISEMIKRRNIPDLWIGLSDLKNEGNFEWVDGTPLSWHSFSGWHSAQPDDGEQNEDCVHYSSSWNYKWNDVICYALFQYLCEQKPTKKSAIGTSASTIVRSASDCPTGWTLNPDSRICYHIGEEKFSFDKAKEYCGTKGGYLAIIPNSSEMSYARGLLNLHNIKEVWIGLRRTNTGLFRWIDDTPLSFQNWTSNQPDNYLGMEDCVTMDKFYSYLWNDDACYKFMQPFCMKKLPREVRFPKSFL